MQYHAVMIVSGFAIRRAPWKFLPFCQVVQHGKASAPVEKKETEINFCST